MDTASAPPNGPGVSLAAQGSKDENIPCAEPADSAATNDFLDSDLMKGLQQMMVNYIKIEPPAVATAAGFNVLHGVGKGTFLVLVKNEQGLKHLLSYRPSSYLAWDDT